MNCSAYASHLHDLIDNQLSPSEAARVETHLAACPACSQGLARLRAFRAATAALPRDLAPARDLWLDLAAQLTPASPASRPQPTARFIRWFVPLAVAAGIALLARVAEQSLPQPAWAVASLAGTPRIDTTPLPASGQLRRGQWLETDAASRAEVSVGTIGRVSVEPNSRLRLVATGAADHRLELARGSLSALIWAPPRLFFVDTPSATAVDLGCAYTLTVDDSGHGELRVTAGYVALEDRGRESIIPYRHSCLTQRGIGPGTPFADDAPAPLRAALQRFDFDPAADRAAALATILAASRPADAVTLWHLLSRVPAAQLAALYDTLAAHHSPPDGVTRAGILSGDTAMRRAWGSALGLGSFAR